jgi:XTP/dITP diphosphohydrolase
VSTGARLTELVETMSRLRRECPWDARQTHESLVEYLIEEAYEVVEAIEASDDAAMREELGDLLLQVVFHAHIAAETHDWNIDDVIAGINEKLISRHPHVFADLDVATVAEVEANWHARKTQEKGRSSLAEGIPVTLPALLRAAKLQARSASLELPAMGNDAEEVLTRLIDQEALGAFLFDIVGAAQARGWDAEGALRSAINHRIAEIHAVEDAQRTSLG